MVRQPAPLPSSRNRNRVTFKTRLRIHVGEHQADTSILDDDTEKTRQQQRVFGVDQEDANVSSRLGQSELAASLFAVAVRSAVC